MSASTETHPLHLSCTDCGADLKFLPGSEHLHCEHCGAKQAIQSDASEENLQEHNYLSKLQEIESSEQHLEVDLIQCNDCGAETTASPHVQSADCPYCASPLVSIRTGQQMLRPKLILPFKLDKKTAQSAFQTWIKKLWFAPNDLKKAALSPTKFQGIYLPYWTFDAVTQTAYTGERVERDSIRETVSGSIRKTFDDVLVPATESICREQLDSLEPWALDKMVNYDDRYLSGFACEKYSVDLENGFNCSKTKMEFEILELIGDKIGGDYPKVTSRHTLYDEITFKHILLPVYVCAYRFKEKVFTFVINAQTGEVQGERPKSRWKIVFTYAAVFFGIWLFSFLKDYLTRFLRDYFF